MIEEVFIWFILGYLALQAFDILILLIGMRISRRARSKRIQQQHDKEVDNLWS